MNFQRLSHLGPTKGYEPDVERSSNKDLKENNWIESRAQLPIMIWDEWCPHCIYIYKKT